MFRGPRARPARQRRWAQSWACLAERKSCDSANQSCSPTLLRCIQRFAFATTHPATRARLSRLPGFSAVGSGTTPPEQIEQFLSSFFVRVLARADADSRAIA